MNIISIRLVPGEDIYNFFGIYAVANNLEAAIILSCVGSLNTACLRFAGAAEVNEVAGPLEITAIFQSMACTCIWLFLIRMEN